jgi:hypothetical protein
LLTDEKNTYEHLKSELRIVNASHRYLQQKYSKITETDVEPEGLYEPLNELLKND